MIAQRTAVLVVEDEALVRMGIVDELEDAGFEVFEAENSVVAIELLIANPRIEVMFTDIDMPGGVDGLKLAASVRDRWPPVTIIVTSGHRAVGVDSLPARARFMSKPYNPDVVVRSIKEMMTQ
ncbi:response regulator [Rhizobium tumorigenes]|uniref:Response regulator n=1 Tax=Rhizobium tumorigenes TaxID=2041385 RepID=A0AAF1K824_9HYPH|nr:response regulator [Rhizobium tumorigenes]WFR97499.1 response regulator [Rhizobium tumorigenes]